MTWYKPSFPTMDDISARIRAGAFRTIVINGRPFIARSQDDTKTPYYSNFVKRIVAAAYILAGKGMIVRFSEDLYKPSEIKTVEYLKPDK